MLVGGTHAVSARSHLPSDDGDPFQRRQHHLFRQYQPMHQNQITMSKRQGARLLPLQTKPQDQGQGQTQRLASVSNHRQVALRHHTAPTGIAEGGRLASRIQDATTVNLKRLIVPSTEATVVVEADLHTESPVWEAPSGCSTRRRARLKAGLTGNDR